jgi:Domain of unknown function (DUF4129)
MEPAQQPLIQKNAQADNELQSIFSSPVSRATSWGERLLPYLVAAMETCWVDAVLILLVSVKLFRYPPIPLWAPFVLIAGSFWLITRLERREVLHEQEEKDNEREHRALSGSSLFILFEALLVLFILWSSLYTSWLPIDPRWLLALLNDVFALSANAYSMFALVALSVYFCWRGVRLARHVVEPGGVFWTLRLGMGVIIVAIIAHNASGAGFLNELFLLCLVPIFLFCSLTAHALAKAVFVRRYHPLGLQGSVGAQERALLSTVSVIGLLILLLAFGIGIFASPSFLVGVQQALEPVGRAYDWLVGIIAYGVTFLLYPIIWLLSLLHFQSAAVQVRSLQSLFSRRTSGSQSADPMIVFVVPVLKILLPLLFVCLMLWLMVRLLRRRQVRIVRREPQDVHESLWSWELFLGQIRVFFLALWHRFFPQHGHEQVQAKEEASGEPTARTMREIYRALLRWAATRGYARQKDETPYEFRERLGPQLPQSEPELGRLTELYITQRYGDTLPAETEVASAQADWASLQHKSIP